MKQKPEPSMPDQPAEQKRNYVSQTDVPSMSLRQALRVAEAIRDNYGGKPASPFHVAKAMNLSPNSSNFRMLTGAAIAYGIIDGGAYSNQIAITDLGMRAVRPLKEDDDLAAMREAFMRPKVLASFLNQYHGSPVPREEIAQNVLLGMGVPLDRAKDVFDFIVEEGGHLGMIQEIKGKKYVQLPDQQESTISDDRRDQEGIEPTAVAGSTVVTEAPSDHNLRIQHAPTQSVPNKRVFVTHGKNRGFVDPIKKVLAFGELEPIVSIERESVSQPVPDKVMEDMRSCSAAIIHVESEQRLMDGDGNEHMVLNPNVLIEIGAALALYGHRFILLVQNGCKLPSNLQGLYEVRYSGDVLDADAAFRLLDAVSKIKAYSQPGVAAAGQ